MLARLWNSLAQITTGLWLYVGIITVIAVVVGLIVAALRRDDRVVTFFIAAAGAAGIVAIPALLVGGTWGHDSVVRAAGYTVEQQAQPDYDGRPPVAVCRNLLSERLGDLAGEPRTSTVNYYRDDRGPACSMVIDQRSLRAGLSGVVTWHYQEPGADAFTSCAATDLPAWRGWASNSLRAALAQEQSRRNFDLSAIIGRCVNGGDTPHLTIPAYQWTGNGAYRQQVHGGVYTVTETDGQRTIEHVPSGDPDTMGFLASFYPTDGLAARTIGRHRNANPDTGFWRRQGFICPTDETIYEPVGSSEGSGIDGNVREFGLVRTNEDRMDAVTPMTRCGASSSIVGVAIMDVSTFQQGTHNETVLHLRDSPMQPIGQMSEAIVQHPTIRVAPRLIIHELTPLTEDAWTAQVGTRTQVALAGIVDPDGNVDVTEADEQLGAGDVDLSDIDPDLADTTDEDTDETSSEDDTLDELRDDIAELTDTVNRLVELLENQTGQPDQNDQP